MGAYKMRQGSTKEGLLSLLSNEEPEVTKDKTQVNEKYG